MIRVLQEESMALGKTFANDVVPFLFIGRVFFSLGWFIKAIIKFAVMIQINIFRV